MLNIENIVALNSKQVIGFIYEPIGPITHPLYSVQLYPDFVAELTTQATFTTLREALHGIEVFLVKRTLKVLDSNVQE